MLVNKWSLFYCVMRDFFKIVFYFFGILLRSVFFFRGLNIMRVINHSSLQLTFSSNRPIGLQGFTATRISPIYVWKTVKQLQYPAVIVLTKTRGELQTFPALLNVTQKTTFSSPCSDKSVAYCTTYLQKCRPDWWRPLNLMNEKKLFLSTHVYDEEKSIFAQNQNLQLQHILNLLW